MPFFNETEKFKRKRGGSYERRALRTPARKRNDISFMSLPELYAAVGNEFTCDTECYPNFWFAAFKHKKTGKIISVEISPDQQTLDKDTLGWILSGTKLVTFNGISYDMPMMFLAMSGANNETLYEASCALIGDRANGIEGITLYEFTKRYGVRIPKWINHIDLIEVAPLQASLKTYAGRCHCARMQDLPIEPGTVLTQEQAMNIRHYCVNDLDNTELLRDELTPHIKLREKLGKEFEADLRSLSDAQMAEVIVNREYHALTGNWPKKPGFEPGTTFKYVPPSYIKFRSKAMQAILAAFASATFVVGATGHVEKPPELDARVAVIDGKEYTVGLGGLHSKEKAQTVRSTEFDLVIDRDVTGYYPNLILKNGFFPKHLGVDFLRTLQTIVDKRYAAKRAGDDVTAGSLKIASNGIFGKLSDPYSTVYGPEQMVQVTLTGQLSLLMVIEYLSEIGFKVMSANTDGIVTLCPKSRYEEFKNVFAVWEKITGLETEETKYRILCSRDVNNYIAIGEDGKAKAKGVYTEKGSALNSRLSKNPASLIVSDAVKEFLSKGTAIDAFIMACQDIRRFVTVVNVKGGAHKDGEYLGKVVRFYYGKNERGTINYVDSGNNVPNSDGAIPAMDLPTSIPEDLDFARYIDDAVKALSKIGYYPKAQQAMFF